MPLKLMYITNRPNVAVVAEKAGVDRIFVDFEYIGKDERQHGLNTVQNHHTIEDVTAIRSNISKAELLVRINPIHKASASFTSSKEEIDSAIEAGADIIMLPYFKSADEVKECIEHIGKRAKFFPLLETPEAVEHVDEILSLDGIDEIHIGINDLALGYHRKFMFELLVDGTVEMLCKKFKGRGIPYGFGGIASIGNGLVPAELIIAKHYELGSTRTILSRSFCNIQEIDDINSIDRIFTEGVKAIRDFESVCAKKLEMNDKAFFEENTKMLIAGVENVVHPGGTE